MQLSIMKERNTLKKNNRNEYIDTDTSLLIGSTQIGSSKHLLYRTSNYKYKYVVSLGETVSESTVADISFTSAKKWAYENLTKEEYDKEFTVLKSDKISSTVISVDGTTFNKFERIRGNTGKSISEILVDMIDYYEQTHGSLDK